LPADGHVGGAGMLGGVGQGLGHDVIRTDFD
jgi:hypothetical protein